VKLHHALALLSGVVVVVGIVNFATFRVDFDRVGGSAVSPPPSDGRFFVSDHGDSKEVDEGTWIRIRRHERSLFITHPLAMIAMFYLLVRHVGPAIMYRGPADLRAAAEKRIRSDGPPLAKCRCGGRIGSISMSVPLVRVEVHSEGLWIKPFCIEPIAIPSTQITGIRNGSGWISARKEILHTSTFVDSPIVLFNAVHPGIEAHLRRFMRENESG
jgi:hypothetical protein